MNIKLLATDMDDTLLSHDLTVSPENYLAMVAAEDLGVHVVLASGRSLFSMVPYVRELGMDRRPGYVISWNGAQVTDSLRGTIVFEHFLNHDLAHEIVEWAVRKGLVIQTHHGDTIRVIGENNYSVNDAKLSGMYQANVDIRGLLADKLPKLLIPGDPDELCEVEKEVERRWGSGVRTFRSKPYFLELMPPEADKGLALAHLANELGIHQSQVMAIGDGGNDLEMIRWAGIGVAMVNGNSEIKAAANWVTSRDNDKNGFAEAVERFILQGK